MNKFIKFIFLVSFPLSTLSSQGFSQGTLNNSDEEALRKTKQMLRDPGKRNKAIRETKGAAKAHGNVVNTVGHQNADELYGISALAMDEIVRLTNGDVKKMQELLQRAAKNPEAFYRTLSPATQDAIRRLGAKSPQRTH